MSTQYRGTAYKIAVCALFSALLVGGKWILNGIPNVEIVSILLAVFSFVWGLSCALPSVAVFVLCEMLLFGFNVWVVEYFIHWTTLAVVFALLGKVKYRSNAVMLVVVTAAAVVLTTGYGAMTSVMDTLISYSGDTGFVVRADDFWTRFGILYIRGVGFFITHIVSNAVIFAVGFFPLWRLNKRMMERREWE
jgi:energy-coupling factor transport system substrate-specific component